MVPRELLALVTLTTFSVTIILSKASPIDFDQGDYEIISDTEERTSDTSNDRRVKEPIISQKNNEDTPRRKKNGRDWREVRCYCNQPHCVSQGYMCRGHGCFTELPSRTKQLITSRPEHSAYSGCLEDSDDDDDNKDHSCPPGYLCCDQDLCNHVDSPAMRSRLNKTLQMLLGENRVYLQGYNPTGHAVPTSDSWFRTATIAVPICGVLVLLVLASLAIRLLQPLPSPDDKLYGFRMPENTPPLLPQTSKIPIV